MTHRTLAELRAEVEADLKPLGRRRVRLLAELERVNAQLRPVVARALSLEITYRRISELSGVTPNTARAWQIKESEGGGA